MPAKKPAKSRAKQTTLDSSGEGPGEPPSPAGTGLPGGGGGAPAASTSRAGAGGAPLAADRESPPGTAGGAPGAKPRPSPSGAGGDERAAPPPPDARGPPELSSDFARRFREMEVDREAMRNYYVIHEHSSRRLHWDLRLERDGVLKSWAIPKEPPSEPGVKRLAVAVEDHPLGYGTFEGEIPPGNYGAGAVRIWDRGRYEPVDIKEGRWVFQLHGERLRGRYCLVRLRPKPGDRGENWLFFRTGD